MSNPNNTPTSAVSPSRTSQTRSSDSLDNEWGQYDTEETVSPSPDVDEREIPAPKLSDQKKTYPSTKSEEDLLSASPEPINPGNLGSLSSFNFPLFYNFLTLSSLTLT